MSKHIFYERLRKHMANNNQKLFALLGVNGGGKTTLANKTKLCFPERYEIIGSTTTRFPREGERPILDGDKGGDYFYVMNEDFKKEDMVEANNFGDKWYGVSDVELERAVLTGKDILLVIESNGLLQVEQHIPSIRVLCNPDNVREILEKEGIPQKEIEVRCSRGNIIKDFYDNGFTPDYEVKHLDDKTFHDFLSWVNVVSTGERLTIPSSVEMKSRLTTHLEEAKSLANQRIYLPEDHTPSDWIQMLSEVSEKILIDCRASIVLGHTPSTAAVDKEEEKIYDLCMALDEAISSGQYLSTDFVENYVIETFEGVSKAFLGTNTTLKKRVLATDDTEKTPLVIESPR